MKTSKSKTLKKKEKEQILRTDKRLYINHLSALSIVKICVMNIRPSTQQIPPPYSLGTEIKLFRAFSLLTSGPQIKSSPLISPLQSVNGPVGQRDWRSLPSMASQNEARWTKLRIANTPSREIMPVLFILFLSFLLPFFRSFATFPLFVCYFLVFSFVLSSFFSFTAFPSLFATVYSLFLTLSFPINYYPPLITTSFLSYFSFHFFT